MRKEISNYILKRVGEGKVIPHGYGLAYYDYTMQTGIFYPIPINVIIRFVLFIYWHLVGGISPLKFEKRIRQYSSNQYRKGFTCGKERGYKDGYDGGKRDMAILIANEIIRWREDWKQENEKRNRNTNS